LQEKFEDTKGLIRSCKSKCRNAMDKRKRTNNDLQNTQQKTKDREIKLHYKPGINLINTIQNCIYKVKIGKRKNKCFSPVKQN